MAKEPSGKKYEFARQSGIRAVSLEWLEQSVERGMILEETLFNPMIPIHQRGKDAWIRRSSSSTSLGKRPREDSTTLASRKLRRTASARLDKSGSGLWGDIVGAGTKDESVMNQQPWDETSRGPSTNSPINRVIPEVPRADTAIASRSGMFAGKHFVLQGFKEKQYRVLQKHLLSHDAEIWEHLDALRLDQEVFVLVPHQSLPLDIAGCLGDRANVIAVTEFWIEKCLFKRHFIEPGSSITHSPFPAVNLEGFEKLIVSSTAFQDIELTHVAKIVKIMGGSYSEDFTPTSSVLICAKILPDSTKRQLALQWNVPTVSADWLWDSVRWSRLLSFEPYLIQSLPKMNEDQSNPAPKQHLTVGHDTNGAVESVNNFAVEKAEDYHRSTTADQAGAKGLIRTSSSMSRTESIPLREITPNSSPSKSIPSPIDKPSSTYEDLRPAISSLLAHHQSLRNRPPSHPPSPAKPRTRRKILGRVPSNMSARSTGAVSHASSIDTLNTDGLGTPLSAIFPPKPVRRTDSGDYKGKHIYVDPDDDQAQPPAELPPGTQLGYEDPDVMSWRERVLKKFGATNEEEDLKAAQQKPRRMEATIKDTGGRAVHGIAGRTRAARAGR